MSVTTRLSEIFAQGDDALNTEGVIMIAEDGATRPENGIVSTSADNSNIIGPSSALTFRATTFSAPETKVSTQEIGFRGDKFTRPKAGNSGDGHTMELTFRVDKYWKIYNALREWKNKISNNYTGIMYGDSASSNRKTIFIDTLDANGEETGEHWTLNKAFIKSLGEVAMDQASEGDAITTSVTFGFLTMSNSCDEKEVVDQTVEDGTEKEVSTTA